MELRVALVAGLHVEARRATVERLLTTTPDSVTLHHDLSTAPKGTVLRTLRDTSGVLSSGEAPLVNDCACCACARTCCPSWSDWPTRA